MTTLTSAVVLALAACVPGVSPSAHLKLKLNGGVLARIFSGRITTWDDLAIKSLNPGATLPGSAIAAICGMIAGVWGR